MVGDGVSVERRATTIDVGVEVGMASGKEAVAVASCVLGVAVPPSGASARSHPTTTIRPNNRIITLFARIIPSCRLGS